MKVSHRSWDGLMTFYIDFGRSRYFFYTRAILYINTGAITSYKRFDEQENCIVIDYRLYAKGQSLANIKQINLC